MSTTQFKAGDRVRMTEARIRRFGHFVRPDFRGVVATVIDAKPCRERGYIRVQFDGFGTDTYVYPSSVELAPTPPAGGAGGEEVRHG